MGNKEKEIFGRVLAALLPAILTTMVKVVEEVVRADLNRDGDVGFGGPKDAS